MNRAELRVLATATSLAATLGGAGFAFEGVLGTTDTSPINGRGGGLQPLVVQPDSVRSLFDSEDGLFPGHSADISMRVANPNRVTMTITSITPAAASARTVTGGTTPDDSPTHEYCTAQLTLDPAPRFAIDNHPATHRIAPNTEATIVLRSAVTLAPDTDDRCQRMQFQTRWTVAGQST
ncbi:hypothetical protein [Dactylosporangium sp. CA-092794]|uniref:hypothetical protein n=1 Tax=Dactylosporangium sp. CA-092794 TaxID=3239929 RepID=UPI003D8DDBB9